jgi:hypothetical protein
MNPFFILVALIGGDCDDDRPMCTAADGLEDMDCPHDIGCVGLDGLVIGKTNERLCREMENEIGFEGLDLFANGG